MSNFVGSITGISQTGLDNIDNLLWGNRWQIENDNNRLTYSFINDRAWDEDIFVEEENAFHNAMRAWSDVADFEIEFSEYNDHNAEITFHSVDAAQVNRSLGKAMPPGETSSPFVEGDVLINWQEYQIDPASELAVGSYDYLTYVHEIGHALGLAHPHDDGGTSSIHSEVQHPGDAGEHGLNQFTWTSMSYFDINSPYSPGEDTNWGFVSGPMAFDIAAVQHLYGANLTHNTGNDTYYLPTVNGMGTYWSCIWDAGGTDTISGEGATNAVTIDLNNASLANDDPNAGGYISRVNGIYGGFTIANSQGGYGVIENAVGSSFGDRLTGNEYNNQLYGESGNDILFGGNGDDTLVGGNGNDTLVGYSGGNEFDILTGGMGTDTFVLGDASEIFYQGNDYAIITDFNWEHDYVQVRGVASQYSLGVGNWTGSTERDTAIYFDNDLVSIVQDSTDVDFDRDFVFV